MWRKSQRSYSRLCNSTKRPPFSDVYRLWHKLGNMGDVSLSINDIAWHTLEGNDAVLSAIGSNKELGLSPEEAAKRLNQYGPNALTPPKKPSFAYKLWLQVSADCISRK